MNRKHGVLKAGCLFVVLVGFCVPASAQQATDNTAPATRQNSASGQPLLWRDPGGIASRDLTYGPGSKEGMPAGKLTFLKEESGGATPKFDVEDEQGAHWRVKVGPEARAETAATRLVWAVGYFTDEVYYVRELQVAGMPKLSRGQEFVSGDGMVKGARLERLPAGRKKLGSWSWSSNPFVGTKELSGLKVMMALLNNWDLKEQNNAIYDEGGEQHYLTSDVGASFGRTGGAFSRSKDNLSHYNQSEFIRKATPEQVDFDRFKQIPRADAKWIGGLLSQLSAEQIGDCFRAAGYSPEEVEGYTKAVMQRIAALKAL